MGKSAPKMPESIMEAIERKEGTAFANALGRMFVDTFSFNPIPQVVKPIAEAGLPFLEFAGFNRRFTGAPVVPRDLQDVRLPWMTCTEPQPVPFSGSKTTRHPSRLSRTDHI